MNIIETLGFNEGSKLLIIHADDAGLSHSGNSATIAALQQGSVNSYSLMVTCPWFYEMAQFARENEHFDYGIHLTLTCEWENYKFGPVLPKSEVASLTDKNGFFYPKRETLKMHAKVKEVRKEFCAQIDKAYDMGLSPSHLDSHMYSAGSSLEIFEIYKEVGKTYGLPVLINHGLLEMVGSESNWISSEDLLFDYVHYGEFQTFKFGKLTEFYRNTLQSLEPGLNLVLVHPAYNNHEMKGIAINHPNFGSDWRQIDFDFFTSEVCRSIIKEKNIQMITWREIQKVIQQGVEQKKIIPGL